VYIYHAQREIAEHFSRANGIGQQRMKGLQLSCFKKEGATYLLKDFPPPKTVKRVKDRMWVFKFRCSKFPNKTINIVHIIAFDWQKTATNPFSINMEAKEYLKKSSHLSADGRYVA
jgi:hypothetical protein